MSQRGVEGGQGVFDIQNSKDMTTTRFLAPSELLLTGSSQLETATLLTTFRSSTINHHATSGAASDWSIAAGAAEAASTHNSST
jgi:hypothetical protein